MASTFTEFSKEKDERLTDEERRIVSTICSRASTRVCKDTDLDGYWPSLRLDRGLGLHRSPRRWPGLFAALLTSLLDSRSHESQLFVDSMCED